MTDNRILAFVDAANGSILDGTISLDARKKQTRGAFAVITTENELILGRIATVAMTNPIHADDAFAPAIMTNGSIPHWSGEVDIERATVEIISVLDRHSLQSVGPRGNPPSGTAIVAADQATMDVFAREKQHCLVLGHIPNTTLHASVINRHFGPETDEDDRDRGGYGEARHVLVVGQNGSGKTVLVVTLVAGKVAAHPEMGLLIPDTSGDLTDPTRHSRGRFKWNFQEVLQAAGVQLETLSFKELRLTDPETLASKLGVVFKNCFNMKLDKGEQLAGLVVEGLFPTPEKGRAEIEARCLAADAVLDLARTHVDACYTKATRTEKQNAIDATKPPGPQRRKFENELDAVRALFDGSRPVWKVVRDVLENGAKIIIDMQGLNQSDHRFVMKEVIDQLTHRANVLFRTKRTANALIVLDEGQRWVPEGADDEEGLAEAIQDGFRTTRKLGIGWMIVAQSPAGLAKKIIRECHTKYIGRNVGLGVDRKHVEEMLGPDGFEAYRQLSIQGGYFWVASGLDNNFGEGSGYFAFHPFSGDATRAFIDANPHIFGGIRARSPFSH